MSQLKSISGKKLVKLFLQLGWVVKRTHCSHKILVKADRIIVIPVHSNKGLPKGTLLGILKDAGISKEEYEELY